MLGASLWAQAQVTFTEYNLRPAVPLRQPIQADSIDQTGTKFTPDRLLKTHIDLGFSHRPYTRVSADTCGYVTLDKVQAHHSLHLLATRLRAERFMKGKLNIYCPTRFELYADGKLKQAKESVQDSLATVNPTAVSLRLEPEVDVELVIKLLASATDPLPPMLKCEFVPDSCFGSIPVKAAPDQKRRFSLRNTTFGSRVSRVSLSPCGKYLLTNYLDNYDVKRKRSRVELTEVKGGRVIWSGAPENARWMPQTSKLYYTVKGERGNDLLLFDPATGSTETAVRNLPEEQFGWARTEDYLIFTVTQAGEQTDGPLKRLLHPDDRIPGARDRYQLARYDLKSGLYEQLTYGSHSVYLNDVSADGTRWLCSTSRPDITRCPFSETAIFEIDLNTLQTDTLVAWDAYVNQASYSPDGSQVLILGSPNALGGAGRNCGNHPVANDFDVQAFVMDRTTRAIDPITRHFNPSISSAQWNATDGAIYLKVTDEDCERLYRYTPGDRRFARLPLAEQVVSGYSIASRQPNLLAYVGGGDTSVGAAYLYDVRKQKSTLIANPMKPDLDEIDFGKQEDWNFTAADGTLIKGQICLPPDFDPSRKYPLIVYYYGGTTPTTRGITSPYGAQVFASRDYVVYVVNPSGAIGYGQEFSARHVNAWGDYTANEIIEGTKKFCEAHPFVDTRRIGCLGASYGGFMTMLLQTKTDLFAAAASHAGISDITSYWGEGYWGYSYNSIAAAGSYPWNRPDLFTRHSPLFSADKIKTPLLILQGTVDTNVPLGESIQMYNALKILGKPVEYIQVEGENHFISDYDKRVLWQNSIMAWFARWLQGDASWWNDLYPERHW